MCGSANRIQETGVESLRDAINFWIPAFAGMTSLCGALRKI